MEAMVSGASPTATIPGMRLPMVCLESYTAQESKAVPKWKQNEVFGAGVSYQLHLE